MLNLDPQQFASWAQPLDMLYACHTKVKNFCRQLQKLPDYLEQQGMTAALERDIAQILTYFNQAAPLHHEDEEKDFFPALIKHYPQAQEEIERLEQQHIMLHRNWSLLSAQLLALKEGKRSDIDAELIKAFIAGYDSHIAIEEPLFELGKKYLSATELNAMGKIMSKRRLAVSAG
ncbi:hemerythrin HHE cation binding domain-containing protein [Mesocricetibacter intestinalis]|uniref:Hemerythrin HHE cation binding domain-containing protein n=1 Tax=Mesocricetibacter intestinalis TaxID=1521930 RepID=A0A4R6VCU0_9PAST|nr:hemerythrin domain-containing protein [Mesocricetibacter intestinalis]TDQ59774.1 hemerythrin HHE cation binding domain-containing protein [Mesocricetibacter intestinalis]